MPYYLYCHRLAALLTYFFEWVSHIPKNNNFLSDQIFDYFVLMAATCQTTEAELQAGLLPAQGRRKERFEKVSAAFDYY